jgi:hypothetical protein
MFKLQLTIALILLSNCSMLFGQADPIRAKLELELERFDQVVAKSRTEISSTLEKRLEAARSKKNKQLVDQIISEKTLFEEKGELPKSLPQSLNSRLSNAKTNLERAYNSAIGEYTKAKQDELADDLQKELRDFQNRGVFGAGDSSTTLFNGKDLTGFHGLPAVWTVNEGSIVGSSRPGVLKSNTCLVYDKEVGDFEMSCQVKLSTSPPMNSGIQFRSKMADLNIFRITGPQCDFGDGVVWGSLYDEGGARILEEADRVLVDRVIKIGQYNEVFLRCVGSRVTIRINGVTTIDKEFPAIPSRGVLAFQVHKVKTGDVYIKEIKFRDLSAKNK